MDTSKFRALLKGIVASSIPVIAVTQPGTALTPPSPALAGIALSGCSSSSTTSTNCGGEVPHSRIYHVSTELNPPLTYQECLNLCKQKVQEEVAQGNLNAGSTQPTYKSCTSSTDDQKQPIIQCEFSFTYYCVGGRRPAGLQDEPSLGEVDQVGRWFAELAYVEEAAVAAFQNMVQELQAHNAPTHFIQTAQEAVDEEVQHAAMMQALAARYGAQPIPVQVAPPHIRSLEEIALDNATEGCVRETYGALCATWQTEHAQDDAVRAVTHRIVHEESRHAALSWELETWLFSQLPTHTQQQCLQARQEAIADLESTIQHDPPPSLAHIAGLPSASQAKTLLQHMKQTLWT